MSLDPMDPPDLYDPDPNACPACGEPAASCDVRCQSCDTILDVYEYRAGLEEAHWDAAWDREGER